MAGEMKKVAGVMAAYKVASDLDQLKNETEKIKKIHQMQLEEAENLTYEAKRQNEILEEHNQEMKEMERVRLELVQDEANEAKEARNRKELIEYVDRCAGKGYGPNYAILVQKFYDANHLLAFDTLIERLAKLSPKFSDKIDINKPMDPFIFISNCENRFWFTNFWKLLYDSILEDNCEHIMDIAIKEHAEYKKRQEEDQKTTLEFRLLKMAEFISLLISEREKILKEEEKKQLNLKHKINSEVNDLEEEKLKLEKSITKLLKIKSLKATSYISYLCIGLVPLLVYFNYMSLGTACFVMSFQLSFLYKLITLPKVKKEIEQLDEKIKKRMTTLDKNDQNPVPDLTDIIDSKFATIIIKYSDDPLFEDRIVFSDNLIDQAQITNHLRKVFGVDDNELSVKGLNKNQRTDLIKNLNCELNHQIVTLQGSDSNIHKTVVKIWYLCKVKYEF